MTAPLSTAPFTGQPIQLFARQQGTTTDTPVACDANGQILCTLSGGTITGNTLIVGTLGVQSSAAQAFWVGQDATNPILEANAARSVATIGLKVTDVGGGGAVVLAMNGSGTNVGCNIVGKGGASQFTISSFGGGIILSNATTLNNVNLVLGTGAGTQIGTATSQKLAFWAASPAAQQVLATGGGLTVDNVITFLQSIGLCRQA